MPKLDAIAPGSALPERTHEPNEVDLFFYNASLWNGHRIHYDAPYTEQVEGYPGVVVDGPLQGDWLCQVVTDWMGDGARILEFGYNNRRAAYLGERLVARGEVTAVAAESGEVSVRLSIEKEDGTVTTSGEAVVRLQP
ncbi:MAG: hypothetical protein HKP27_06080 [Myxococcales bacterium]|nr:hypothetical protein [Myxococcales bacterium]